MIGREGSILEVMSIPLQNVICCKEVTVPNWFANVGHFSMKIAEILICLYKYNSKCKNNILIEFLIPKNL